MLGPFKDARDKFYAERIRTRFTGQRKWKYWITQIFTLVLEKQLQNKEN